LLSLRYAPLPCAPIAIGMEQRGLVRCAHDPESTHAEKVKQRFASQPFFLNDVIGKTCRD
jgi:hypothetical protein